MEIRKARRIKGSVLAEVLVAASILVVFATSALGVFKLGRGLLHIASHKAEAIHYARTVADKLLELTDGNPRDVGGIPELSIGKHDKKTDADICTLPECYFRDELNGELKYKIEKITIEDSNALRVQITVEWDEPHGTHPRRGEDLFVVPFVGEAED